MPISHSTVCTWLNIWTVAQPWRTQRTTLSNALHVAYWIPWQQSVRRIELPPCSRPILNERQSSVVGIMFLVLFFFFSFFLFFCESAYAVCRGVKNLGENERYILMNLQTTPTRVMHYDSTTGRANKMYCRPYISVSIDSHYITLSMAFLREWCVHNFRSSKLLSHSCHRCILSSL